MAGKADCASNKEWRDLFKLCGEPATEWASYRFKPIFSCIAALILTGFLIANVLFYYCIIIELI